jgi:hypothetical protein
MTAIEEEANDHLRRVDCSFRCFAELEAKYKFEAALIEEARLYQIKLLKILRKPIPYKKLEDLCGSNHE